MKINNSRITKLDPRNHGKHHGNEGSRASETTLDDGDHEEEEEDSMCTYHSDGTMPGAIKVPGPNESGEVASQDNDSEPLATIGEESLSPPNDDTESNTMPPFEAMLVRQKEKTATSKDKAIEVEAQVLIVEKNPIRRRLVLVALCIVAVGAIVAVMTISLSGSKNALVIQTLQPLLGKDNVDLLNDSEIRAYRWMTDEDPSGILEDPDTPSWRVEQRFLLALLYFETGGPASWLDPLGFLYFSNDECTWSGRTARRDFQKAGVIECDPKGRVKKLSLPNNNLIGTIPRAATLLSNLVSLDLAENQFSGPLLDDISLLTNLRDLDLSQNFDVTGTIPSSWASLTALDSLYLYDCVGITGTLPEELSTWTGLRFASFNEMSLTGTLPSSYESWTDIEVFQAELNILSGTLPPGYSSWTNLKRFRVSGNDLTGSLPSSYQYWKRIEQFYASTNRFSGTIPTEYNSWGFLKTSIELQDNQLTGEIPVSLFNERFSNFSNNNLTGMEGIPSS